jgi:hypothetical protein
MSSYNVGYKKPPKQYAFKPGRSGNPKGRPKYNPAGLAESISNALAKFVKYREQGRIKAATRYELAIKILIDRAVKGNVANAELILKIRAHARQLGDAGVEQLQISGWLPDYPGQTAEQKTRDVAAKSEATPVLKKSNRRSTEGE